MEAIPEEERHRYISTDQDYLLRSRATEQYACIVVDFFCERVDRIFRDVLRPVYKCGETITRFESQHRGSIHAHVLAHFPQGPSAPEQALAFKQPASTAQELKDRLECMQMTLDKETDPKARAEIEQGVKDVNKELEDVKAADPARQKAIKFYVQDLGFSELHPNLDPYRWKPPFGNNSAEPLQNVLRQTLAENMESAEDLQIAYERLVNRIHVHNHTFS